MCSQRLLSPLINFTLLCSIGLAGCGGSSVGDMSQQQDGSQVLEGDLVSSPTSAGQVPLDDPGENQGDGQSNPDAVLNPGAADTDAISGTDAVASSDSQAGDVVAAFDIAESLFTEADRQWYCSVDTSQQLASDYYQLSTSDSLYFSADGTAVFERFREVYWNRNMENQEINIASPFIGTYVMKNIMSQNTTMQFTLLATDETATVENYDCILVAREDVTRSTIVALRRN